MKFDFTFHITNATPRTRRVNPFPSARTSKRGHPEYNMNELWPYGGLGYILSRGLLRAIGREEWEQCTRRFPCQNADQRVSVCVFNAGYTVSRFNYGTPASVWLSSAYVAL